MKITSSPEYEEQFKNLKIDEQAANKIAKNIAKVISKYY